MLYQTSYYGNYLGGNNSYRNPQFSPSGYMIDQQQQQPIGIKGRFVSSLEEARASIIDFDGSIFYFPDPSNQKIYTKQINLDGTAILKVYQVVETPSQQPVNTQQDISLDNLVTKDELNSTIKNIMGQIQDLKKGVEKQNEYATNDDATYSF